MTTFIGTANGYIDLLAKLDQHLTSTGHAWGLTFTGTGNGRMRGPGGTTGGYIGTAATVTQTVTVTFTSATDFNVSGTVTGSMGSGTVGVDFVHAQCQFRIVAGGTAFQAGDVFTLNLGPKWERLRLAGMGNPVDNITSSFSSPMSMVDGTNSTSTTAVSAAAMPATMTWKMDFATTVKSISISCGHTAGRGPATFTLDWSDDGASWTTLQTYTGVTGWTSAETRLFTVTAPISKLWWRVRITASQGAQLDLNELYLCADVLGNWRLASGASNIYNNGAQGIWRAPGVDGTQQIHVGAWTYADPTNDIWNLRFTGMRYWNNASDDPQLSAIPNTCGSKMLGCTKTAAIAYWLVVNGGRFILGTRISGVYQMAYGGFFLPYETPTDYPFPLAIGGMTDENIAFTSSNTASIRCPYDPGAMDSTPNANSGLSILTPAGAWRQFANRRNSSSNEGSADTTGAIRGKTWPYSAEDTGAQPITCRDNVDGSQPLLPVVLFIPINAGQTSGVLGEFDGIYWAQGFGNAAEAIVQDGAVDVIMWPNGVRTDRENWGAFALD